MAGFIKSNVTNGLNYVLTADGGHKALSDFAMSTALSGYLPLSGGKMTGDIDFNGYAKIAIDTTNAFATFLLSDSSHRASGVYGYYDSTRLGHVWSMGTAYRISNDGHDPNTLYGLAYFHTNWSNSSTYNTNAANKTAIGNYAGGHLVGWFLNGVLSASIGSYIWTRNGFLKNGSSNNYVLLGGGGHKAVSDFLPLVTHSSMSTDIPSDLVPGIHVIYRPNIEYSSVLAVKDYNGQFALLYFHPTAAYTDRILYRKGSANWYTIAYTSDLSSYLPLTGGTLTGNLSIKKSDPRIYFYHSDTYISDIGANTTYGLWLLNHYNTSSWESHYINLKDQLYFDNKYPFIHSGNISSYAITGWRTADALGAGGAPITTSVNNSAVTNSYYILATTSSGSCGWYQLPSTAFSDNNTTYSAGTGLSLDGTTFNAKLATNALLGVTKYVKYYSAASVKRYNGDVGGSEVDTSTTSNIELAYASSTSGRFYPVLVDKNGFPFVNIPWSDTNTTYTFTTSGSGNVLTGVSTSGTTITFTKGNVSSGSTYGVASTSSSGLAPQLSLDSTNTIASQSTDYVLTYKSGTNTTPVWRKLPTNAFLNDNSWREIYIDDLSISSNSLNLKHGTNISLSRSGGDVTITASTQFLVVSSLPSGSSITSGVLYLVTT